MSKAAVQVETKERPIIFGTESVLAIIEGRKTQTRRVIKPQPCDGCEDERGIYYQKLESRIVAGIPMTFADRVRPVCPYGKPGDRLWVREAWYSGESNPNGMEVSRYLVEDDQDWWQVAPRDWLKAQNWRPHRRLRSPIHMPRWASRLTLEITEVRVERLQEIKPRDAAAEGMKLKRWDSKEEHPPFDPGILADARELYQAFRAGWDSINGKRPGCAWKDNPFCWVISFKRVQP